MMQTQDQFLSLIQVSTSLPPYMVAGHNKNLLFMEHTKTQMDEQCQWHKEQLCFKKKSRQDMYTLRPYIKSGP